MIQVNLIPVRAQKRRENVRQFVSIYLLSVVLLLLMIGYTWNSLHSEAELSERRLTQLRNEVNQYAKFEAMLKDLQQKKETIDKKREIIKSLQDDRDKVVRILALLSVEMPADKIWFEKLSLSGNSMTLNGVALSNEAIAEFMRNLELSPYVEMGSVNLVLSRQISLSDMKLREFQLAYRFLPFSAVQQRLKPKQTGEKPADNSTDKS
jgi:type IV pilus assembly protein PilN